MKTDLRESNRRDGYYWVGKKPYVSVTTVLKILDKPALRYWYGREVYRSVILDPTMDEKTALAAPYRSSKEAASVGTNVHSIVENYSKHARKVDGLPDHLKKYAQAFYDWVDTHNPEVTENELTAISNKHRYAGTMDMVANIAGVPYIIDIKTGKGIYDEVELQLSAYGEALVEKGKPMHKLAVLLLEKGADGEATGNYIFKTVKPRFKEFLAAKTLWTWLNEDKNKKYGYK